MPHMIEEAKSGRASCRTCREKIGKGELRFGEEAANAFDPEGGATHQWHHLLCAARKKPQLVKETLETFTGAVPNRAEVDQAIAESIDTARPPFPFAEHAPTARSRCQSCRQPIDKGMLRVAVARPPGSVPPDGAAYVHTTCAVEYVKDPELLAKVQRHSRRLSDEDLAQLQKDLTPPPAA
ncbi:MAG: hypothetical protein AB2A00_07830 [Myxococcota bacterium]